MIIEHFRNGDAGPVYRRFDEQGRLMPDGLKYVNSWVSADLKSCFQVMESPSGDLLREWIEDWEDHVDFEVIPVVTSTKAREIVNLRTPHTAK